MNNENTNQTESDDMVPEQPVETTEKQDVVVEVTGFQLEILKGL
jgi:hypothetical protein